MAGLSIAVFTMAGCSYPLFTKAECAMAGCSMHVFTMAECTMAGCSMSVFTMAECTMHYGAVVKWGQKWPTLTNYFSVDVDPKIPKICT